MADVTGRFFLVANGLQHDPRIRDSFASRANVTVTEEPMTAGFYEAVVRSLAES